MTATAQWYDYRCELPENMYFNGKQWHYEYFSLLGTTRNNQYLSVSTSGYSQLLYIPPISILDNNRPYGGLFETYDATPYSTGGNSGYWYVSTDRGFFLVSQNYDGTSYWSQTSGIKYYGTRYRYAIGVGVRVLSFVNWHICPQSYRDSYYDRGYNNNNDRYYNHNHYSPPASRYNGDYRRQPTGPGTYRRR